MRLHRMVLVVLAVATVGMAAACSISTSRSTPDLPAKPADYAEVLDARIPYGNAVAGDDRFRGPHFSLWMTHTATTDTLDSGWASGLELDGEYRAAAGHEFVLAHFGLTSPTHPARWKGESSARVSAAVASGGRKIPLARTPTESQTLVVSVPAGAPAYLEITDEGRTQSINLRDGTRGPDVIALYNPLRARSLALDRQLGGVIGASSAQGECVVHVIAHNAVLDPYHPAFGWAPDGRAWLQLSLNAFLSAIPIRGNFFLVELELDIPATFGLIPSGGQRVPAVPADAITLESAPATTDRHTVLFEVSDSFRSGTVVVTPTGPMTASGAGGELSMSWTRPPAPWELEISLPA